MIVGEALAAGEELGVADDRVVHRHAAADRRPSARDLLVGARLRRVGRAVHEEERRVEDVADGAGDLAVLVGPACVAGPARHAPRLPVRHERVGRGEREGGAVEDDRGRA